jgi:hypothetical protein
MTALKGTFFVNLFLSKGGTTMAKKKLIKGTWTKADLQLLKKQFPSKPTAAIAAALGRPNDAVKKKASRMGLRKAKQYLKSLGRGK